MLTVPVGPGNLEMHLQLLKDMGSTCFGATASMALLLAEEVERAGLRKDLRLRKVICGAEPRSEKMRLAIESKLGLEGSYDIGGMTEMYGPGTAIDCDAHAGLHYWADLFIVEVLDPATLEPVPEGQVGEMVVTSLCKEAVPLLRYRTHDLTRLLPGRCPCGLNMPRHDSILGRSDDMIVYRGVNIYPGQIMEVIETFDELGGEYQMELTRDEHLMDHLTLTVERAQNVAPDNDVRQKLERKLHKAIQARITVSLTDYASLPRTFSKSKRVLDSR
jgi:phenylacetate-CoA ligase